MVIDKSKLSDENYYWIEYKRYSSNKWIPSEYYNGKFFVIGNTESIGEYLINNIDYKPISR